MAAVQADIQRLIANPPPRRIAPHPTFESEAEDTGTESVSEFMQVAMRKLGCKTREEVEKLWAKDVHAEPVKKIEVSREMMRHRARKANMPDQYREHVIDRVPLDCQALSAVKDFLKGRRKLLMLSGGKGTWKSGSSCYAIGQVDGSRYVDACELVDVKFHDRERFNELMSANLVVLDDLEWGVKNKTPAERAQFMGIWMRLVVNAYTRGRRLITNSNILWEAFAKNDDEGGFGVLVADRWTEAGDWIDVEGESMRPSMRDKPHWTENPDEDDQ